MRQRYEFVEKVSIAISEAGVAFQTFLLILEATVGRNTSVHQRFSVWLKGIDT